MSESIGYYGRVPEVQADSETSRRLNEWLSLAAEGEKEQALGRVVEARSRATEQLATVQQLITGEQSRDFANADVISVPEQHRRQTNPDLAPAYTELTRRERQVMRAEEDCIKTPEHEAAIAFVDKLSDYELQNGVSNESLEVASAFRNINLLEDKDHQNRIYGDRWIQQYLDNRRDMKEHLATLKKYGYNPKGEQPEVFKLIAQDAKAHLLGIFTQEDETPVTLARERARSYEELRLISERDTSAVSRALRHAGFKEMPNDWRDKEFSTYEIVRMCEVAREAIETQ